MKTNVFREYLMPRMKRLRMKTPQLRMRMYVSTGMPPRLFSRMMAMDANPPDMMFIGTVKKLVPMA